MKNLPPADFRSTNPFLPDKSLRVFNQTRQTLIAQNASVADTFLSRMIGLLNRSSLPKGEALIITRCQSIHMLFMRFPIDVIFIDTEDRVVGLVPDIKPFGFSPLFFQASCAIELPSHTIQLTQTAVGDRLSLQK
jgi:uncharacterized membrane protein (UPF0127 family)